MSTSSFGLNESYVESMRAQWSADPMSVSAEWREYFGNGEARSTSTAPASAPKSEKPRPTERKDAPKKPSASDVTPAAADVVEPIRGVAAIIAENMEASLQLPTAMSTRVLPVKVLEENRRVINSFLINEAFGKCSFTHLIAWALVEAVSEVPAMNNGYTQVDDKPVKLVRSDVNLGLAVDLPGRDGSRSLVVPNIKGAQRLGGFWEFFQAYNALIAKARSGKLGVDDFQGTTISLTNPGGAGTVASAPRLMPGQGTIIAVGAIDYPAEYQATAPETLRALGVGKVMTMTSTYDHRVIQGAESGAYLKRVHELLSGQHAFYERIFESLRIPHNPYKLKTDRALVSGSVTDADVATEKAMRVSQLIHAFRVRGMLLANTDPLDLQPRSHPELNLENYGLTIWDLDREFLTLGVLPQKTASLRAILERLRDTYCRTMGVEYMYINDVEQKEWLQQRVERTDDVLTREEKERVLQKLSQAQGFERFLHKRYMGHKRFSVEGAESVIPMLTEALGQAASFGVTDVIIGMAHRGRLNVLANVVGKSFEAIFSEFEDVDAKTTQGSGDVKYHLGAKGRHRWRGRVDDGSIQEREVRIELACNPSHLEAVNTVVMGQCRARQDLAGDRERQKVLPILIHGDAAFSCQGVVFEGLQMSGLQGYRVGGTLHIIINNQIGYTTGPDRGRTATHASDVARAIGVPVLRVNGDDPEACIRAIRIASEWRRRFSKDVVVDLVCYRRHGHNETDEPAFTQPVLYRAITAHTPTRDRYADLLVRRKDFTRDEVDAVEKQTFERLERAFDAIKSQGSKAVPEQGPNIPGEYDRDAEEEPETAVSTETLKRLTERLTYDPEVIEIHPRVKRNVLERRREMVLENKGVDFGLAENLAYGSLLLEGIPVRLSGQDCGRGTFAHRHAVLYDVRDGRPYIPLNYLDRTRDEGEEEWHPSRFRVYDSPLSEEGVLGFEYGYSVTHPDSLVIWEAQFGDFFNGAQVQVDQFIVAGEAKWGQKSRVCLLLPHGYDGQGPEHSSARVERFLQMCAEANMRVAICSTPAQLFHLLRRQAKQPKKPLVCFTHKSLLRAEDAASPVEAFAQGRFSEVLDDPWRGDGKITRTLLCTGKIFWELQRARAQKRKEDPSFGSDLAILRVEQLYPFPWPQLEPILARAPEAKLTWVQEEPQNMGAWDFMVPRLRKRGVPIDYMGRLPSASPATGSGRHHRLEQRSLIELALTGERPADAPATVGHRPG